MEIRVHNRENFYFGLKLVFTVVVLYAAYALLKGLFGQSTETSLPTVVVFIVYAVIIWLYIIINKVFIVAYMKGNGISVSEKQFKEFYAVYRDMATELGIKKLPRLFVLQQGGLLNAFAIRFSGKSYIAIYSDVFALIESDIDAVRFVIGHELGHVKRNHMSKRFWTFPSSIIPFLTPAYSRSCEYTCDNIGNSLSGNESLHGLLVLAAGKELYKQVDVAAYIEDAKENRTMAVKFAGLFMSHPYIPSRLKNLSLI